MYGIGLFFQLIVNVMNGSNVHMQLCAGDNIINIKEKDAIY